MILGRSSLAVPYTTNAPVDMAVNETSQRLNAKGVRAFEAGHFAKAEALFRESLESDLNFGPAHNNLGQIYLARHELYLAAWEFEYAASLMPELVEPIVNQGLAYETGERIDRAAEFYQQAYDQQPNHPIAIASLVRARIKQDGDPTEIGFLLDELIMHDGRPEWVVWAKELRATKYRDPSLGDCECATDSMGEQFVDPTNPEFNFPFDPAQPSMSPQVDDRGDLPSIEQLIPPENSILLPSEDALPDSGDGYWEDGPPLGRSLKSRQLRAPIPADRTSPKQLYSAQQHEPSLNPVRQASFDAPVSTDSGDKQ